MEKTKKLPELLSPAGSLDALKAAVSAGADAVYIGGASFNARLNAKNFTAEEMREGARIAHAYGAKLYVTANTLIYDIEKKDFLKAAEEAYLCGADALIVADIGGARLIKDSIPIELHASTQVSGHNAAAAMVLYDAGFSRMVCAREMSERDMREFIKNSPIEAEVFIHGALCVCHSGQCLFSSVVGGRSGNRGECAQPCRLPYRMPNGKSGYPLSLKDLSLAQHIPKLIEMGVSSLKIEGRMKSPEYVRDVTRIWRSLLDAGRGANASDMAELSEIFSRGGFTDGYFTERIDRKMLGVRSESDKENTRRLEPFTGITCKNPIELSAKIKADEPISLSVADRDITVFGDIPEKARTAPLDIEAVKRSLLKWGNTPYEIKNIDVELDDGLIVPVSALNALRREAADMLMRDVADGRSEGDISRKTAPYAPKSKPEAKRTAVFYSPKNIPDVADGYFDIIYVPIREYDGSTKGVMLPAVIWDSECAEIETLLSYAKERGATDVLVGNIGHIELAKRSGLRVHGDLRLNITNGVSASVLEALGFEDVILSPELTIPQIRDIRGRSFACVYGRLPLMITEKCVGKELSGCDSCKKGRVELVDRKNVRFPVLNDGAHRSIIFNGVPTYMADRLSELSGKGIVMHHYIFTVESKDEARKIIEAYKKGTPPSTPVRRIK